MKILLVILVALMATGAAFGDNEDVWSITSAYVKATEEDSDTVHPTSIGKNPVYYHVDDDTDSDWLAMGQNLQGQPEAKYTICLDPDTTGALTGNAPTVNIYRTIGGDTNVAGPSYGYYTLLGVTLTGVYPFACIYDVPGGESIRVYMVSGASETDPAVVMVRRQ